MSSTRLGGRQRPSSPRIHETFADFGGGLLGVGGKPRFQTRSAEKRVGPQPCPLSGAKSFGVLEPAAHEGTCTVKCMDAHNERPLEKVIQEAEQARQEIARVEQEFKDARARSKALALELITIHHVSVAKTSLLSGHTRQTIKIWLDVWNAEHRNRPIKN